MQFDELSREGIDDSNTQEQKKKDDSNVGIDLAQHFQKNGLSSSAYKKISQDVESGDINVEMLSNCSQNQFFARVTYIYLRNEKCSNFCLNFFFGFVVYLISIPWRRFFFILL